jgi:hypothetical protein
MYMYLYCCRFDNIPKEVKTAPNAASFCAVNVRVARASRGERFRVSKTPQNTATTSLEARYYIRPARSVGPVLRTK